MRRWLQFGIMDLLLLTAVVAVVLLLFQPARVDASKARPWVAGGWSNGSAELFLFPDGYYAYVPQQIPEDRAAGVGWTITRGSAKGTFVLRCGELRFLLRNDGSKTVMELLADDGSVTLQFQRSTVMEGPISGGMPDGTWSWTGFGPALFLEYRNGELVDFRDSKGWRELDTLNALRSARGLPVLTPKEHATMMNRHD